MKKLFLIFLLLFTPISAYTDGGPIITSSGQLTEKILPLDYKLMDKIYTEIVVDADCYSKESIFEPFIDGDITIPFSGQDLLQLCREKTHAKDILDGKRACKKSCSHFVLTYMQAVAQKNNASTELVIFDYDLLVAAFRAVATKAGAGKYDPEHGADCLYDNYLNGQITDSVSTKDLRDQCVKCFDDNIMSYGAFWKSHGCTELVIEYKSFFRYLTDY